MKDFFKLIICIICVACASQAFGDPSDVYKLRHDDSAPTSKKFMNYVFFGVGAGTLVGVAAITGFRRNFSENMDVGNVWRGASYGLYAGILLGIYACYLQSDSVPDEPEGRWQTRHQSPVWPSASLVTTASRVDGAALVWQISIP